MARRLIRKGRFVEAEARLAPALAREPGDAPLLTEHAWCAHNAGCYVEAVRRWRALLEVEPRSAVGVAGVAANLRESFCLGEAEVVIAAALAMHPDDSTILSEGARIAEKRYRYADAFALWSRAIEKESPPQEEWRQGRDLMLVMLGRLDEAEVAIVAARERVPDRCGHLANEVLLRMRQGRWDEAQRLAAEFRRRWPDDVNGLHLLGEASHGADLASADTVRRMPVEIERVEDDATRSLLLRFESLGEDCEFGLVQRRFAAEPLGLLRWNFVAFADLVAALEARFEGLGDPAQTEVGFFQADEYSIHDKRWRLSMHTFAYRHQVEPGVLLGKMCLRLRYLRDKFVNDLAADEKIFVFKAPGLSLEATRELHRALRVYGPVRLLCVVLLDKAHADFESFDLAPATVREIEPGLLVGTLTRGGGRGGEWDVLFDEWVALCVRAETVAASRRVAALVGGDGLEPPTSSV